jgi:hypothetical protein
MIATLVSGPTTRIAVGFTEWCRKLFTILRMSQQIPEIAQPLWMPPRCCDAIVRFIKLPESGLKYLKNRRAAKPPPQGSPLTNNEHQSENIG